MGRISGSYPGGPRKREPDEEPSPPPKLDRAEDIAARGQGRRLAGRRRRRRRRLNVGFVVAVVVAGVIGLLVGMLSHRTTEDITAEREQQRTQGFNPSGEVNRMLMEMWKMEQLELTPRAPGGS